MSGYIDKKIVLMIRVHARRILQMQVLHCIDLEDIEQELMFEVIRSIENYNQNICSIYTFVEHVIKKRAKKLLKDNLRLKRGGCSLFEEYFDEAYIDYSTEINVDKILSWADFDNAVSFLSPHQRTLCELARRYSISEIAEILGVNRATLYSRFKVISRKIKIILSKNSHCSNHLLLNREGIYMKNISILETLSAKELSKLDVADLMDLNDQITNLNSQVKEMKQKLDDGLNLRFAEAARSNLQGSGKDTGTARFFDGTYQIIAEIPKKVTWDTEKMEEIIKKISKERKEDLIKITYSVDERKYLSLPPEWQSVFKEARTVTPGKARYQITLGDQP